MQLNYTKGHKGVGVVDGAMAMKHFGKEISISACIIVTYNLPVLTFNLIFQIDTHRYWKGNFLPQFFTNTKPDSTSLSHVDSPYKNYSGEEGSKVLALLSALLI